MSEESETIELSDEIKALAKECMPDHVAVVQAILSGKFESNAAAYQSVYGEMTEDSACASASRMLAIVKVRELYNALRDESLMQGVMSRAEAMKILSDMASTPLSDLVVFDSVPAGVNDDGEPVKQAVWNFKPSALLDEKAMRSISELATSREGLKIKQHDQKAAIKQLSEMAGWDAAKKLEVDIGDSDYLKRLRESLAAK